MSKTVSLSTPKFGFVVGTRAALALGAGLLISRRLSDSRRRNIGRTLVAVGLATTLPAAILLSRARRTSRG
jgi:Na+-driven multidrug efflux pump